MFTILPRAFLISGRNAWITATWPIRLTSSWRRKSSIGTNSSGPAIAIPALFTRPATPAEPAASSTRRRAASIDDRSVTSRISGSSSPVASARRLSPSSCLRTPANTRKPDRSSRRAHARPMPVELPLITTAPRATRPRSLSSGREPQRRRRASPHPRANGAGAYGVGEPPRVRRDALHLPPPSLRDRADRRRLRRRGGGARVLRRDAARLSGSAQPTGAPAPRRRRRGRGVRSARDSSGSLALTASDGALVHVPDARVLRVRRRSSGLRARLLRLRDDPAAARDRPRSTQPERTARHGRQPPVHGRRRRGPIASEAQLMLARIAIATFAALLLQASSALAAQTINVSRFDDPDPSGNPDCNVVSCSLREAVEFAEGPSFNTVALSPGTYELTRGELVVSGSLFVT